MSGPMSAASMIAIIKVRLTSAVRLRARRRKKPGACRSSRTVFSIVSKLRICCAMYRVQDTGYRIQALKIVLLPVPYALCGQLNARVEHMVEQIADQIHDHHGNPQYDGRALDDRVIAPANRLDR